MRRFSSSRRCASRFRSFSSALSSIESTCRVRFFSAICFRRNFSTAAWSSSYDTRCTYSPWAFITHSVFLSS